MGSSMMPLRFGAASRQLFGLFHPASPQPVQRPAVLLCPPFGQEAIRSHRVFRLLAERLAFSGVATLRFDWYGTGDSAGEDADADLAGWKCDLLIAHRQLDALVLSGRPIVWLGLRLGASVAAMTARDPIERLGKVILWSPVVDGRRWLIEQAQSHAALMRHVRGAAMRTSSSRIDQRPTEAIGFEIPAKFADQVSRIDAGALAQCAAAKVALFAASSDADIIALNNALAGGTSRQYQLINETEPINWANNEALGAAVAPATSLAHLTELATAQ
jgi:uncharacterized protein